MSPLLPRILPGPDSKPSPQNNTAAAFRAFARDLAAGRRPGTTGAAGFLSDLFDQLAGSRDSDQVTGRDDPLHDALARGGPFRRSTCLEIGSGTGLFTPNLSAAFDTVISIDLSEQMLRQAAGRSHHTAKSLPAETRSRSPGPQSSALGSTRRHKHSSTCQRLKIKKCCPDPLANDAPRNQRSQ
ncbi:methyltransferase domain-containing protein [Streptomyces sp. NPDC055006]